MSAVEILDAEVRDEVRRQGIDPLLARDQVRVIVRNAVNAYGERGLVEDLPSIDDPALVERDLIDLVAGHGPLQRFLDDPSVDGSC